MAEPYQEEFQNLVSEGQQEPDTQAAPQPTTQEEMIDLMLEGKQYRLPVSHEIPFKHNGTIQKVPFSKLLNHYRQADHMDSRINEYKTLKQQIEEQRGDLEKYNQLRSRYETIDKWSLENPDQWERLHALWQQREQALSNQGDPNNALLQEVNGLRQKLAELEDFKSTFEKQAEAERDQKDIEQVNADIEAFQKEWQEIDLSEKDQNGITVKEHVIAYGVQNGIPDFESAALKYLKPRLLDTIAARARNDAVKGVVGDKKRGIIARGSTPQPGQSDTVDPRKYSYEELKDRAKAEFSNLVGET